MFDFGSDVMVQARMWRLMGQQAERQWHLARVMGEAMVRLHPARLMLDMMAAAARDTAPARAARPAARKPRSKTADAAEPALRPVPEPRRKTARRKPARPPEMPALRAIPGGVSDT